MTLEFRGVRRFVQHAVMVTAVLTGILHANAASAATFYVATSGNDANPGTLASPFRTIAKGLAVIRAGDTLYIRGGTYNEGINSNHQTIPTGTSWSDAPLISGYSGETVVLTGHLNMDHSYIQYVVFSNLVLDGGAASFFNGAHHVRLQNSVVKNAATQGIHGAYTSDIQFINLKVHNNGSTKYDHGIYAAIKNMLIDGCEFYDNSGYGIHIYDTSGSRADNSIIRNNRVYNNRGAAGVILSYGTNIQFYNNIVYNNLNGVSANYSASNVQFYNNTIYNHPQGSGVEVGGGASSTIVRNNILYQNGTPIINAGSGTVTSNNLTTNPMFVNASGANFKLQSGSPAIDTGATISAVTTDFDKASRPAGAAYDIGAYEFASVAAPAAPTNVRIVK